MYFSVGRKIFGCKIFFFGVTFSRADIIQSKVIVTETQWDQIHQDNIMSVWWQLC